MADAFVSTIDTIARELAEVAESLRRCTVQVRGVNSGRGSGVLWRPNGLIVTNAHVATSAKHTVHLPDGRVFQADLIARDRGNDLAALRIVAEGLPSVVLRKATSVRAGELVVAVGNPLNAAGAFAVGVVSATPNAADTIIRADIRLVAGNSGSPLADAMARVLGINSMVMGGFGIAVTSDTVEQFLAADHACIGVTLQPLSVVLDGAIPVLGLMLVELDPGGPAHLGKLLVGDVIVRVDGQWLNAPKQLADGIHAASDTILIEVLRARRLHAFKVAVARESLSEVA